MKANTQSKTTQKEIQDKGLKVTKERVVILNKLKDIPHPISAEELFENFKGKTDKVTIYRTLKSFAKAGLVYQTNFFGNKSLFEYQQKHHHHIVCVSCGLTEEIKECILDKQKEKIKKDSGFQDVINHSLEFLGKCKKCYEFQN